MEIGLAIVGGSLHLKKVDFLVVIDVFYCSKLEREKTTSFISPTGSRRKDRSRFLFRYNRSYRPSQRRKGALQQDLNIDWPKQYATFHCNSS